VLSPDKVDKTLVCRDCKKQFAFTATEQDIFAKRGFTSDPGRCPECREARQARNGTGNSTGSSYSAPAARAHRETHTATCSDCGAVAEVPFVPSGDRPVYCRDCFAKRRG
jgi:CxxC-x17-CxxC domain-containing protein